MPSIGTSVASKRRTTRAPTRTKPSRHAAMTTKSVAAWCTSIGPSFARPEARLRAIATDISAVEASWKT